MRGIWIRSAKDAKHILDADDSRMVDLGLPFFAR